MSDVSDVESPSHDSREQRRAAGDDRRAQVTSLYRPGGYSSRRNRWRDRETRSSSPADSERDTDRQDRLVIAIDYGTTYTGVAYATPDPDTERAVLSGISVVNDWGRGMANSNKIPSVISYSLPSDANEEQWGFSLSPNAIVMINTKLELDHQDNKSDELDLILQALEGMDDLTFENVRTARGSPEYTWQSPEEIVGDYLEKVFEFFISRTLSRLSNEYLQRIAVDVVITVPVNWSYKAQNSTLRAIDRAFKLNDTFPNLQDIITITEPEAAAIYAARYLKQEFDKDLLKEGEYFILCDAGGGTVDVVAYKVKQADPLLLEQATMPTGGKCGSIFIDEAFKNWLKKTLGERNYRDLDPKGASRRIRSHATEGRKMRSLMSIFEGFKKTFELDSPDMKFDLPEPLQDLTYGKSVVDGELTLTNKEMRTLFDPVIDEVSELIQSQILQIGEKHSRVKNIILVGGFSESPYLQQELDFSYTRLRSIQLRRPETSWTAVVQGAVIHGIEKAHFQTNTMGFCPKSWGIMVTQEYKTKDHLQNKKFRDPLTNRLLADGQMVWLVQKNDLVLSSKSRIGEHRFTWTFKPSDTRNFKLPIFEYGEDDLPMKYSTASAELKQVAVLSCDLSKKPLPDFEKGYNAHGETFLIADCICKVDYDGKTKTATASLWWKDKAGLDHEMSKQKIDAS